MQEGGTYVFLGLFWLLMVAITGARKTLSTYIYTLIGVGGVIYGLYLFMLNAAVFATIIVTAIVTVVICLTIGIYIWKNRDTIHIHLTSDEVPEMTPEERYLYDAYKNEDDETKNEDEIPLR